MKPIETTWNGYRFRSRLEARWAVFFEYIGLKWEYEPEGFELKSGTRYLPDFRVKTPQGGDIWYEVKPLGVTQDRKFSEFWEEAAEESTGFPTFRAAILSGDPESHIGSRTDGGAKVGMCPRCGFIAHPYCDPIEGNGNLYYGCEQCDFETPCGGENDEEGGVFFPVSPHKGLIETSTAKYMAIMEPMIWGACDAARSARFEWGESPKAR